MASIPSTRSLGEAIAVELKPGLPDCAPAGGCAGSVARICLRSTTTVLGRIELKTPFCGTQRVAGVSGTLDQQRETSETRT